MRSWGKVEWQWNDIEGMMRCWALTSRGCLIRHLHQLTRETGYKALNSFSLLHPQTLRLTCPRGHWHQPRHYRVTSPPGWPESDVCGHTGNSRSLRDTYFVPDNYSSSPECSDFSPPYLSSVRAGPHSWAVPSYRWSELACAACNLGLTYR